MLGSGQKDVAFRPDLGLQRHHDRFAQAVDGRVGDLRELLAEVVVKRAHLVRQHRHRRVVAHRAHRLILVLGEHADDLVALLLGDVEHLLVERERVAVHGLGREPRVHQVALEVTHALLQPALVGMAGFQDLIDVRRGEERSALQVERDHVAGAELALPDDVFGRVVPHAGLGGDGETAVGRDAEARRPQPVAIERAERVAPIRQHDAGRTVPGLHVRRVVLVEGAQVGIQRVEPVPGRRDEEPHGLQRIKASHQQHLEHVVEALGVRAAERHQRQHLLQPREKGR